MVWNTSMWDGLDEFKEELKLWRLDERVESTGDAVNVFDDDHEFIEGVVRPWQSDFDESVEEGQLGHTPGLKLWVPQSYDLSRNDRVEYENGPFRLVNPQHDGLHGLVRWDMRTDDRELIREVDVDEDEQTEPPTRDRFGNY